MKLEQFNTRDELVAILDEIIPTSTGEVMIGLPPELLEDIEPMLETAYQNGVFVIICLYTDQEGAAQFDYDRFATLVRTWDVPINTVVHVDQDRGIIARPPVVHGEDTEDMGLRYETEMLYHLGFPQFLSQQWAMGEEYYVSDPRSLPLECGNLRDATVQSTLYLRQDKTVGFECEVRPAPASPEDPWGTLEGQIVSTRQNFIHPSTNTFFGEMGLIGHVEGEGRVTMGGVGAYAEDYEAQNITLKPIG